MTKDKPDVGQLLAAMAEELARFLDANNRADPLFIGIHTGGTWIARALHAALAAAEPLGELNIAFYRDDFSRVGMHPRVTPSNLPFSVEDRHIVLVDDVLYTGRTIRAAMNEIFDYGRPASITLAVLIDRGGRELPVQADVRGKTLTLKPGEHVKLHGPEPLALEITKAT
jgi:pyrimidine operon attenuation protein/uracil phosphoribosyltransferase